MNGTKLPIVLLLIVVAAASGCSTSVVSASERDRPLVEVVHYDDLDIAGSAEPLILYGRIEQAAVRVCEPVRLQVIAHDLALDCVRRAVADAVANIDTPALTKIHSRHGGVALRARRASSAIPADAAARLHSTPSNNPSCSEQKRRVVAWPRGGHPGKSTRIPRFETRMQTTCDHKDEATTDKTD